MLTLSKLSRHWCTTVAISTMLMNGASAQTVSLPSDPTVLAKNVLGGQPGTAVIGIWRDGKATYGAVRNSKSKTIFPDTKSKQPLLEIGSISKVFTGFLLAQAVERGDLNLDDNLEKLFSDKEKLSPEVGKITLKQLITHTSCMPRLPDDFSVDMDKKNPYVKYDRQRMWKAVSLLKIDSAPPCDAAYSNWGVALVGELLSERYNKPWNELVRERITQPLGMNDTVQILGNKTPRLAAAYAGNKTASRWDMQAFSGAGGLRSTASDMLLFGRAILAGKDGPLGAAAERLVKPLASFDGAPIGYAIMTGGTDEDPIFFHGGATGGYRAQWALSPKKSEVFIALVSNASAEMQKLDLALNKNLDDAIHKSIAISSVPTFVIGE